MTTPVPVVTIDGPSGSGKGTVGQQLAQRLDWHFLDSGALYRALAYVAQNQAVPPDDVVALVRLAGDMEIQFVPEMTGLPQVLLNGEDVSDQLRAESSAKMASQVAVIPEVRRALMQKQHDFRVAPGLVADGRDMGTVVFADAGLKIFLTASAEERAQRRYKQLKEKGFDVNLARLVSDIEARDERDRARAVSPLRPAETARVIDTTSMSITNVVDEIYGWLKQES